MATILESQKIIDESFGACSNHIEKLVKASKSVIILSLLSEKPRSGYDLIKDIFSISNVFLSQGTVYSILYCLEIGESFGACSDFVEKLVKASKSVIILSLLSEKPRSGYDLIKDIFSISNVFLSQGTVYSILYCLEEEGIIEARYQEADTRAKIYHITPAGKECVQNIIQDFSDALQFLEAMVHR